MALLTVVIPVAVLLVVLVALSQGARRKGYTAGRDQVVRCKSGHLFMTTWVPGVSFKAVRLGSVRYQRCPVGAHWTTVRRVKDADLTDEDRRTAAEHRDTSIP
jgi:hypothetical protein